MVFVDFMVFVDKMVNMDNMVGFGFRENGLVWFGYVVLLPLETAYLFTTTKIRFQLTISKLVHCDSNIQLTQSLIFRLGCLRA